MEGESNFSAAGATIFDRENYQMWKVCIETYLEVLDLWEAMEDDYKIQLLHQTLPWHK